MALKDKQILQYNEANSQWENTDVATGVDATSIQTHVIGAIPTASGKYVMSYDQDNDSLTWVVMGSGGTGITNITVADASTNKATFTLDGTVGTLTIPNRDSTGGTYTGTSPIVIADSKISLANTVLTEAHIITTFNDTINSWTFIGAGSGAEPTQISGERIIVGNASGNASTINAAGFNNDTAPANDGDMTNKKYTDGTLAGFPIVIS